MFKKNDMVVKHNNLVRVEVDDMTVVQLKIMNLIISQLSDFKNIDDVTDDDFKFQISHKLILEKLSYSKQVHDLQNEVRSLGTKTIGLYMLDKNRSFDIIPLFSIISYRKANITGEINKQLIYHLFGLKDKGNFTKFYLSNILKFRSKYSILLYEFLKMNEFKQGKIIVSVEDLRKQLQVDKTSKAYTEFKYLNYILIKAKKDIEELTDIKEFTYELIKEKRVVKSLNIFVNYSLKVEKKKLLSA